MNVASVSDEFSASNSDDVLGMAGNAKDDAPSVLLSLRSSTDEDNSQDDSLTKDDPEEPPDLTEGYVINDRFTKKDTSSKLNEQESFISFEYDLPPMDKDGAPNLSRKPGSPHPWSYKPPLKNTLFRPDLTFSNAYEFEYSNAFLGNGDMGGQSGNDFADYGSARDQVKARRIIEVDWSGAGYNQGKTLKN